MEMDFTKVKLNKEQQNNAFLIGSKAQEVGIDPDLALAFAWRENRFQTKGKSPKGATGIMQIMPANAKAYGYSVEDLQDPNHNIDIGLRLFKENLDMFQGNERAALVAYNANPNVAKRYLKNGETPESIPEETRIYLEDIDKIRPLVQRDEVAQEETQIEEAVMDQLHKIVADKQAQTVKFGNGQSKKVDHFTASAITQVHKALNDDNKKKFADMVHKSPAHLAKASDFAFSRAK